MSISFKRCVNCGDLVAWNDDPDPRHLAGCPPIIVPPSSDFTAYREALVILLLKWGGRSEPHVQAEARFTVDQFLKSYPLPVNPLPPADEAP